MSRSIARNSSPTTERPTKKGEVAASSTLRVQECPTCQSGAVNTDNPEHIFAAIATNMTRPNDTPLDRFFLSYTSFKYDRSLPPTQSFKRLRRQYRWKRNSLEGNEAWDQYQNALKEEFYLWYGAEDDIEAWHALCRAIRIHPLPKTCEQCIKAVRNRHVNLVDLIEWGRAGREGRSKKIRIFKSVQELRDYSKETQKIFRNDLDKDTDDGGVVLRHLLRRLFNGKPAVNGGSN